MKDFIYYTKLYDYYGILLTDKQKCYFEDYYFNNLTLSEIAFNNNISRNAVHKSIKETCEKLSQYEKNLKLCEKNDKFNKIIDKIEDEKIKKELKELL